jgi:hypothetical protein
MAKTFFLGIWKDFRTFAKTNPQYLIASVLYYLLASFLLGGVFSSFMIALLSYVITLLIVFMPAGEKLLRFFEGARKNRDQSGTGVSLSHLPRGLHPSRTARLEIRQTTALYHR